MARPRKRVRRSTNKRRKGFLAVALPWLRRFGIGLGVLIVIVWVGAWLWLSGSMQRSAYYMQAKAIAFTADLGLTVENILVEGRVHSDTDVILALVNMRDGDPLFLFDPDAAKRQIEKMEWVERAQIERRLPGTIYIGLQERRPLALLEHKDDKVLLDTKGQVITRSGLDEFKNFITVKGNGAQDSAVLFLGILKGAPLLYDMTKTASYIGERRWNLILKNGVEIKLPETDTALALAKLSEAHLQDGILERDILSIDMRMPDRFVIRTRPGAVQEYKTRLNDENNGNSI